MVLITLLVYYRS